MKVRNPSVAGLFYPEDPEKLRREIQSYLNAVTAKEKVPKGIIAPHAGTIYSGPVAASAYASLKLARDQIKKVVLLGPAHRVPFKGLAAHSADFFVTPLGRIPVDHPSLQKVLDLDQVRVFDEAHQGEHSLELQLPFLQETLKDFSLVPFVVGFSKPEEVAEVLEKLWGGPDTLIVISSDLSHYHPYLRARQIDEESSHLIEKCDWEKLREDQACGYYPVRGFLWAAKKHHLKGQAIDLRNSGDTAGDKERVVGYGAFYFFE